MLFKIQAERSADDRQTFFYDNDTNTLANEAGHIFADGSRSPREVAHVFGPGVPLTKSREVRVLKIQLGLSCNYSCGYCSQRFVERAEETSARHIETFLASLDVLSFDQRHGLKVEFWGGEPFVYWKTMKPLAEALRVRFAGWAKPPRYSVITNGSLLTPEINDWLVVMGFSVGVSHDGPGQAARGPDPFDDPAQRAIILDLYRSLKPSGRFSFNAMLHGQNTSRRVIYEWFVDLTGDDTVPLGEGTMIDAYDTDGVASSPRTLADHFAFRQQAFNDIYAHNGAIGFGPVLERIDRFTRSVLSQKPADTIGQKCGMDDPHVLALDLRGNVVTCQNVSAASTALNGAPHLGGNIRALDAVRLRSARHWKTRPNCFACPVLHLCRGSCMYLEGELWDVSCDNSYSDAVALFALSIEKITGYIPISIEGPGLPAERGDIWGTRHAIAEAAE